MKKNTHKVLRKCHYSNDALTLFSLSFFSSPFFFSLSNGMLLGKDSLDMAKISLARCLSSMNLLASHAQQSPRHWQEQPDQEQQQQGVQPAEQERQQRRKRRQPTGEKLVEFSHNFINRHMLHDHNSYNVLTENNTKFLLKKWRTDVHEQANNRGKTTQTRTLR